MGILNKILHDKDKAKADIDPGYYERRKAYNEAFQKEKVKIAREKGRSAAHKKPFYQALGQGIGKLGKGVASGPDPFGLFGETKQHAKRKRSHKKRKRHPKRVEYY